MPSEIRRVGLAGSNGRTLLGAVGRFWYAVVLGVFIAAAVAYAASFLQETMYAAEANIILADPRNAGVFREQSQLVIDPARYVRNQAERVMTTSVLARASNLENGRVSVSEIRDQVTVTASANIDLMTVRALDRTPEQAASLANSIAEAYQQVVAETVAEDAQLAIEEIAKSAEALQAQVDKFQAILSGNPDNLAVQTQRDAAVAQLVALEGRSDQIAVDAVLYGSGVEVFERAESPNIPSQPKPLRNAALAGVLGLLASIIGAWWLAERNEVAVDRHDPAPILGVPLLAEIPVFEDAGVEGPLPTVSNPGSAVAEAYQFLSNSIDYALAGRSSHVVVVTSAMPSEGKSVTAANLAVAAAGQPDREVILVDSDERGRGLSVLFGADNRPGLIDVAAGVDDLRASFITTVGGHRGSRLRFLPAGAAAGDTAAFFRSQQFRSAVDSLRGGSRFVVMDSPPLQGVADTSAMASHTDGIVLVVSRGTPTRVLEDVRHHLSFVGSPLLGYVFNRSNGRSTGYGRGRYGYRRSGRVPS